MPPLRSWMHVAVLCCVLLLALVHPARSVDTQEWVQPAFVESLPESLTPFHLLEVAQVPGTQRQSWTDWGASRFNSYAEQRHLGGPGAQSWTDFNNPRKCALVRVSGQGGFVGAKDVTSLPAATIERATKGVPAITEKSVGSSVFAAYINKACGPSSDYRGLTMMGYDMPRVAGTLAQWLQKHPYLLGVMGTLPSSISSWINQQPGLTSATHMGPVYTTLDSWYHAVLPEIKAGRPVMCLLGFTAAGMHYVNVVGIRVSANGQVRDVGILDPNDPAYVKLVSAQLWNDIMKGPQYVPSIALGATTIFYAANPNPVTKQPVMPQPVQF